jgi:hypothetical protein
MFLRAGSACATNALTALEIQLCSNERRDHAGSSNWTYFTSYALRSSLGAAAVGRGNPGLLEFRLLHAWPCAVSRSSLPTVLQLPSKLQVSHEHQQKYDVSCIRASFLEPMLSVALHSVPFSTMDVDTCDASALSYVGETKRSRRCVRGRSSFTSK